MTITVTSPAAGKIGPGYRIYLHESMVGPFTTDSYMYLNVFATTQPFPLAWGDAATFGANDTSIVLGKSTFVNLVSMGDIAYPAAGATVQLVAHYVEPSAGGDIDTNFIAGAWVWDPTGGIATVIQQMAFDARSSITNVSTILAAVQRNYPSLPN